MAVYNQEHRDYGVHRKYPFTDSSPLSVSGGGTLPSGLLVDAVLYAASDACDVWLATFDLGNNRATVRTGLGASLSGDITAAGVTLVDEANGLYAGTLILGSDAIAAARRTRYVMTPRSAMFSPSCVFFSSAPGVATINQRAGHLTLEGQDGVRVFTGVVDGRPILRVDAFGVPKTYEGCDFGQAIRCIRVIQSAGALFAVDSAGGGDVRLTGVSSFTGEALCPATRTPDAADVLGKLGSDYSPEAWLASQAVKDAMKSAGYFWLVAPLTLPALGSVQVDNGLILTWTTGAPLRLPPFNQVAGKGDYSAYGHEHTPGQWLYTVPVSVRPFTVISDGKTYIPASYTEVGLINSMFPVGGASTYYGSSDALKNVYPLSPDAPVDDVIPGTGLSVRVDPDTTTYLPFAALVRVKEAPWQPAESSEFIICSHYGRISIYAPHSEEGSNPLKSDRQSAALYLRGAR